MLLFFEKAHILCWFKPRSFPKDYKPIPAIPRTALGVEPRQRPASQKVEPLKDVQHDHVYQAAHVGPMVAELVRPDVSGENWGGYDLERLRISGLARAVQTRLPYLHHCTPLYCLTVTEKIVANILSASLTRSEYYSYPPPGRIGPRADSSFLGPISRIR